MKITKKDLKCLYRLAKLHKGKIKTYNRKFKIEFDDDNKVICQRMRKLLRNIEVRYRAIKILINYHNENSECVKQHINKNDYDDLTELIFGFKMLDDRFNSNVNIWYSSIKYCIKYKAGKVKRFNYKGKNVL